MKRKSIINGVLLCAVALSLTACNLGMSSGDWIAKVGKASITETDLNGRIATYPANVQAALSQDQNRTAVLDQMVNEELLIQEANATGYTKNQTYVDQVAVLEAQLETAKRQALLNLLLQDTVDSKVAISAQDIATFYDQNKAQFAGFEKRKASHILVEKQATAKKLLARLKKGANFEKLAEKNSKDATAKSGGDLGWFRKGDLVAPFEKAVYGLARKGALSGVVKTQFGYHIIKLTGVEKVPAQSLEQSQAAIQRALYNQKRAQVFELYLTDVKTKHKVVLRAEKEAPAEAAAPAEAPAATN